MHPTSKAIHNGQHSKLVLVCTTWLGNITTLDLRFTMYYMCSQPLILLLAPQTCTCPKHFKQKTTASPMRFRSFHLIEPPGLHNDPRC
jgi:hypothetical protein